MLTETPTSSTPSIPMRQMTIQAIQRTGGRQKFEYERRDFGVLVVLVIGLTGLLYLNATSPYSEREFPQALLLSAVPVSQGHELH